MPLFSHLYKTILATLLAYISKSSSESFETFVYIDKDCLFSLPLFYYIYSLEGLLTSVAAITILINETRHLSELIRVVRRTVSLFRVNNLGDDSFTLIKGRHITLPNKGSNDVFFCITDRL